MQTDIDGGAAVPIPCPGIPGHELATPIRDIPSSELAELLLTSIRDCAIYTLDRQGNVATWHPGAERLKGYSESAILGRHFRVFYTQDAREAGEPERELAQAALGGYDCEGWRVREDGSSFWASVLITPLRDASGASIGFAKITRDLSEHRRATEQALRLALAEERLRVRDAFLDDARRELEGALAALRVHLRTLTKTTESQPGESESAVSQKVALLQWGLDRLRYSVQRVLTVARSAGERLERESRTPT